MSKTTQVGRRSFLKLVAVFLVQVLHNRHLVVMKLRKATPTEVKKSFQTQY